jgi:hypothetical protein
MPAPMMRRSIIALASLLVFGGALANGIAATGGPRATLTRPVRTGPPGTRIAVSWKLHTVSGRAVLERHVFVKITCPEGDRSTITYANPDDHGTYLASALVPPGGVGSITVGHGASVFPVTNPYHG